jgi:hypothetical protein
MAKILSFRTPEFRSGYEARQCADHSAEIILFPGVRYERWGDDVGQPKQGASREQRASRDVLELAD